MNTSNITTLSQPAVLGASKISAVFFVGFLMLATLFGNFLVCASFYTFRNLRTICNYFIISLSVADIMVALIAMPFWLVLQLEPDLYNYQYLGKTEIAFWNHIDIFCGTASIMNLAAVSTDRHLAITVPYSYDSIMTPIRAILIICFVWVYATTVSCLRLVEVPNGVYQYLVFTTSFCLPLAAMLIMYARIYVVALRQTRRINRHQNYKTDMKAAKTIAVVIGAFTICWLPFFVIIIGYAIDRHFISDPELNVYKAIKWMQYLNSCLNPIIYCCLNRTYRRAFKKIFNHWRKAIVSRFCANRTKLKSNKSSTLGTTEQTLIVSTSPTSADSCLIDNNNKQEGNGIAQQTRV